jgi:ribosomal protein S18 acetylase RimI-like enzyme
MTVQIRIAGLSDLELLAPLFDGYRQFYGQAADLALATAFLRERIMRNESVLFLAETPEGTAGLAQFYPSFTSVGAARLWILNDLFVNPDCRGRGVASALLEAVAAYSRQTGAARLSLSTAVTNHKAQALYERHGWRKDIDYFYYQLPTR